MRAGAYKPRTSADDFQGLGRAALEIFREIRRRYGVRIVSEVVDVRHIEPMSSCVDILQVGARNMYNYELLKELGRGSIPVLLKNGLSATVEEFLKAAEYILRGGNERLALCERGVRGFDPYTRNTLDSCAGRRVSVRRPISRSSWISAIPLGARISRPP